MEVPLLAVTAISGERPVITTTMYWSTSRMGNHACAVGRWLNVSSLDSAALIFAQVARNLLRSEKGWRAMQRAMGSRKIGKCHIDGCWNPARLLPLQWQGERDIPSIIAHCLRAKLLIRVLE